MLAFIGLVLFLAGLFAPTYARSFYAFFAGVLSMLVGAVILVVISP